MNDYYTVIFVFKGVGIFCKVITQFNDLNIEFLFFTVEFIKFNADFMCFIVIVRVNSFVPFIRDV